MLRVQKIVIQLTASNQQISTANIYTPWIRFELDDGATGTARIGDSTLAGAATAFESLIAGESATYEAGSQGGAWGKGGEMYNLAHFYARSTVAAATEQLHVLYLVREK
jgi:hypothetical protein